MSVMVLLCLQILIYETVFTHQQSYFPLKDPHFFFECIILKVPFFKHDNWADSNLILVPSLVHNMWIQI